MKKAKIALATIAIIAVLGGASAFKSTKSNHKLFYQNSDGSSTTTFWVASLTTVTIFPGQLNIPLPTPVVGFTNIGWYTAFAPLITVTFYAYEDFIN